MANSSGLALMERDHFPVLMLAKDQGIDIILSPLLLSLWVAQGVTLMSRFDYLKDIEFSHISST